MCLVFNLHIASMSRNLEVLSSLLDPPDRTTEFHSEIANERFLLKRWLLRPEGATDGRLEMTYQDLRRWLASEHRPAA